MLYRQKKDTYIRNYDGIGYICSTGLFNDRVVNESGTVFLTALSRKAQSLEELIEKVLPVFTDADKETILKDGKEFYDALVEDGFLVSGETEEELDRNDIGFSYKIRKRSKMILPPQSGVPIPIRKPIWKTIFGVNLI